MSDIANHQTIVRMIREERDQYALLCIQYKQDRDQARAAADSIAIIDGILRSGVTISAKDRCASIKYDEFTNQYVAMIEEPMYISMNSHHDNLHDALVAFSRTARKAKR